MIFELLTQHGEYADHHHGTDPDGLPGWHVIHGPISGWGIGAHPDRLPAWTLDDPLLPHLSEALLPTLAGSEVVTIRIFFGGDGTNDIAEVQINRFVDPRASESLRTLPWSRPDGVGYLKIFVLAVHPEDAT